MKKLLIPALLLAGLALQPAFAIADNNGLEWRSGGRGDIWYRHPGSEWRRAPGSAREVGDGWVIGTDRRNGGFGIYRWDGYKWHRMPGSGVRIGGNYYSPWVVNDRGERFTWTGSYWREEPNFGRRDDRRDDRHDNDRGRDDNDRNRGGNDNGRRDNDGNRGRDDNDWNRGRDADHDRDGRDFGSRNNERDSIAERAYRLDADRDQRRMMWSRGNH